VSIFEGKYEDIAQTVFVDATAKEFAGKYQPELKQIKDTKSPQEP
jgi:hypothetical protein